MLDRLGCLITDCFDKAPSEGLHNPSALGSKPLVATLLAAPEYGEWCIVFSPGSASLLANQSHLRERGHSQHGRQRAECWGALCEDDEQQWGG